MKNLLAGIGTSHPVHSITQQDAAALAVHLITSERHARTLPALYRRTGVKQRYSVVLDASSCGIGTSTENSSESRQNFYPIAESAASRGPSTAVRMQRYDQEALELGRSACVRALESANIHSEEITHLVTVSCSGFASPGVDLQLINALPLAPTVQRVHVGFMGCHGLLNGLRVANGLLAAHPKGQVLLCAVELCSLHQQYTNDPQQLVANALFSDGAAAVVMHAGSRRKDRWCLESQASMVLPHTAELMTWRIGDSGFEMSLSPRVPEVILANLRPWMDRWLETCGLAVPDIEHWAIHPGGPRILSAAAESLHLTDAQMAPSRNILETHGNMSSPTVLFIVDQLQPRSRDTYCVMLAFGPGLTIEATLLSRGKNG